MIGALELLLTGWKWSVSIILPVKKSVQITPAVNLGFCYPYWQLRVTLKTFINPNFKYLSNYTLFHRNISIRLFFTILPYLTNALIWQKMCTNKMRQAKQTSQNLGQDIHFPCVHCPLYKPEWNPLCHHCSMRLEKAKTFASLNCQKADFLASVKVEAQKGKSCTGSAVLPSRDTLEMWAKSVSGTTA